MAELKYFNPVEAFARGQQQAHSLKRMRTQNALLDRDIAHSEAVRGLTAAAVSTGDSEDLTKLVAADPDQGRKVHDFLKQMDAQERDKFNALHRESARDLATVMTLPPRERPRAYAMARERINQRWGRNVLPPSYSPDHVTFVVNQAREIEDILDGMDPPSAPETRTRYEGTTAVQEQWNPSAGQFEEVGRGPRYKPDTNITQIVNPILVKLANGEPISEGEQQVLDIYTRADYLDRLIRGAYENAPGSNNSITGSSRTMGAEPPTAAVGGGLERGERSDAQLLDEARDAIRRGADPAAVERRLRELGADPASLHPARGSSGVIRRSN